MGLFIGIEGVSMRHSVAVASDQYGRISGCVVKRFPLALHSLSRRDLRPRLSRLLDGLASKSGFSVGDLAGANVCIGLTGVTFPYDAHVDLPSEFEKLGLSFKNLICTGDAEIILASHSQNASGSVIVCHSGSTAYVVYPNGDEARVGGWGPALGDEGSGFSMGVETLRAVGHEYDRKQIPSESMLWESVRTWLNEPAAISEPNRIQDEWRDSSINWKRHLRHFHNARNKFDDRTALFAFSHQMSRSGIWHWRSVASSMVIPLMRAYEREQELGQRGSATEIVDAGAASLADQYKLALARVNATSPVNPVVLYGGVLQHNEAFKDLLIEKISSLGEYEVLLQRSPNVMRPAFGALLFALGNSKTGELRVPSNEEIRSNIYKGYSELVAKGELTNE